MFVKQEVKQRFNPLKERQTDNQGHRRGARARCRAKGRAVSKNFGLNDTVTLDGVRRWYPKAR